MATTINTDNIPVSESRVILKAGQYTLRVTEGKYVKYEKEGEQRERVDIAVEVVSPATNSEGKTIAGINWRESIYFTEKALPMAKATLEKFGVSGTLDLELLPGMLQGRSAKAFVSVSSKTLMDENTGTPVTGEDEQPIMSTSYRVNRWLAKA